MVLTVIIQAEVVKHARIDKKFFLWVCVSFLPSKYLKVELLGLRVYVCLSVYEAVKQFSKRANHFTYPLMMYMSPSSFLTFQFNLFTFSRIIDFKWFYFAIP